MCISPLSRFPSPLCLSHSIYSSLFLKFSVGPSLSILYLCVLSLSLSIFISSAFHSLYSFPSVSRSCFFLTLFSISVFPFTLLHLFLSLTSFPSDFSCSVSLPSVSIHPFFLRPSLFLHCFFLSIILFHSNLATSGYLCFSFCSFYFPSIFFFCLSFFLLILLPLQDLSLFLSASPFFCISPSPLYFSCLSLSVFLTIRLF